jgi:hypothetical protein
MFCFADLMRAFAAPLSDAQRRELTRLEADVALGGKLAFMIALLEQFKASGEKSLVFRYVSCMTNA